MAAAETRINDIDPRKRVFDYFKQEIGAVLEPLFASIHANTPAPAITEATKAIEEAGKRVEDEAIHWMTAKLTEACANVHSSMKRLSELVAERLAAERELAKFPVTNWLHAFFAFLYSFAALVALGTEVKLTEAFSALLGYRGDDPTAKVIGLAFAFSLFVFKEIFLKLGLLRDPWPFFRAPATSSADAPSKSYKGLRFACGVALLIFPISIAILAGVAVVKMAELRPIYAAIIANPRVISAEEMTMINDASLLFSVCILVVGGYLAAAAKNEFTHWKEYRDLQKKIENTEKSTKMIMAHLDQHEKPTLAGALGATGLPCTWVSHAMPDAFAAEFDRVMLTTLNGSGPLPAAIRAAAASEAALFTAEKQVALAAARAKEPPAPPARPRRSCRETVEDILYGELARP